MSFRFRFPTLLLGPSAARPHSFWGAGAQCVRTTPWHIDTLRAASRCTAAQPENVRTD